MIQELYTTKRSLELEWQKEYLKSGRHNVKMIEINKKIQDVIKAIIAQEFEEDTRLLKIKDAAPEASIAG